MVFIAPLVGAAVFLSGFAAAAPGSSNYGSNNYGGDSSNNNYGGNSNNYGGNSNNYGGNSNNYGGNSYGNNGNNYGGNNYDTTSSTETVQSTSTTMMMDSSSTTMMMDTTSTTMMMETSSTTTTSMMSETTQVQSTSTYTTASYGSGSNYWGGSGYNDCVNQCIAQYGAMTMGGSYQATATSGGSGGQAGTNGNTHTVIVAATKGLFRFMPFAVNASVGDTVEFRWGADNHTVTKSSELLPCNKSDSNPFSSGEQNKDFVFSQVVNDTNPTYYYCGTPGHCPKGMFGVINAKQAAPGAPSSLAVMLATIGSNSSDVAGYAAYSSGIIGNNAAAGDWGKNIDIGALPGWAQDLAVTNALFTRNTLAMNTELLQADNSVDLSSVADRPLMLPMDISDALANGAAAASSSSGTDAPVQAAATSPTDGAASSPSPTKNGAGSVTSSRLLVAAFVVVATVFAL